jgi:peptide/nickel transport system permease protein
VRNFLLRRLIQSALLLWVLMTFTFVLVRLTPGGPEAALLEQPNLEAGDIERLRERFGLNDPLPVAYGKWLASVARLDFGRSYHYLRPPLEIIGERLAPTAQLAALAALLGLAGIPIGVYAALHRGRAPDQATRVLTLLGDALPNWWLGLVIIVVLSATIGWFPSGQGQGGFGDWLAHIIAPALILATGSLVAFTRFTRSQVLEVLGQEHVRTARAKGLLERTVTRGHVLRNALLPSVTLFGSLLPPLVSGAAVTESVFSWPGMGRLFLDAAATRDYPLLLAIVTIVTLVTLLGTLLADLLYGFVDPRIKYG